MDSSRKDSKGRYTNREANANEEEDYNRRREEEIRRQLKEKEVEMRTSGKNFSHSRETVDKQAYHSFNPD